MSDGEKPSSADKSEENGVVVSLSSRLGDEKHWGERDDEGWDADGSGEGCVPGQDGEPEPRGELPAETLQEMDRMAEAIERSKDLNKPSATGEVPADPQKVGKSLVESVRALKDSQLRLQENLASLKASLDGMRDAALMQQENSKRMQDALKKMREGCEGILGAVSHFKLPDDDKKK